MVGQKQNGGTPKPLSLDSSGRGEEVYSQNVLTDYDSNGSIPLQVEDRPIIFFDGDCVLCNGFVDFLLQIDLDGLFYLSPLQGETARRYLPPLPHNREEWSIYYFDATQASSHDREHTVLYCQSDAVIQICRRLGGLWSLVSLGRTIPSPVRDAVYRLVARNRYRLLGQRSTCRMPTDAERSRFLP